MSNVMEPKPHDFRAPDHSLVERVEAMFQASDSIVHELFRKIIEAEHENNQAGF